MLWRFIHGPVGTTHEGYILIVNHLPKSHSKSINTGINALSMTVLGMQIFRLTNYGALELVGEVHLVSDKILA